jgi:hypothetical protein
MTPAPRPRSRESNQGTPALRDRSVTTTNPMRPAQDFARPICAFARGWLASRGTVSGSAAASLPFFSFFSFATVTTP